MLQMYFSEGHTYILMTPNAKPINTATGPIIHRYQRKKEKKRMEKMKGSKYFDVWAREKRLFILPSFFIFTAAVI